MRGDFWHGKKVFITGCTGFKGSWLALWLYRRGATLRGYSLNPPTKPSMYERCGLRRLYPARIADVRDYKTLRADMAAFAPDIVFHLAAQPLVLESYKQPLYTYETNIIGTANVLEAALRVPSVKAVVNVTSDKCYENTGAARRYCESDRLGGDDPYSSSKACAELVDAAYLKSFYVPAGKGLASARAGNVIGGGDWAADRLLPDFVRAALTCKPMFIRNPGHTRPWQHVLEPLCGYILLAEKLYAAPKRYSGAWNFGPGPGGARPVKEVIELARKAWGTGASCKISRSSAHEAKRLELNSAKAKRELGWRPKWRLETAVAKTVAWAKASRTKQDMLAYSLSQIAEYETL
ncbi:MAG: CDP-glucose 4,6-dehydratase [Elusimicrobia bacterium]|nr:CDP-glucose 4,6-dehydratase [Elusimicrobiota bacterium]